SIDPRRDADRAHLWAAPAVDPASWDVSWWGAAEVVTCSVSWACADAAVIIRGCEVPAERRQISQERQDFPCLPAVGFLHPPGAFTTTGSAMPDDKHKGGPQDRTRINLAEDWRCGTGPTSSELAKTN